MSFASEITQVTKSAEYKGTEQFNQEAPTLPQHDPDAQAKIDAAKAPAAATEAPPEAKVKIGDQEYNSVHEAYVAALAQVADSNKLMQQTVTKLTEAKAEPAEVQEAWELQMEKLFFVNPAEAIIQIYKKAASDAVLQIDEKQVARSKADANAQAYESFMQSILTENAELSDFRSVIENVVIADQQFWNSVKDLPLDKAKGLIADKTRDLLKIKKNAEAKTTELPSGPAKMAGVTGNPSSVADAVTSSPALDFITQLRKHNKRSK